MRDMTARQVNPTPFAQKRRSLEPTPLARANKKRGASAAPNIAAARSAPETCSAAKAALVDVDRLAGARDRHMVDGQIADGIVAVVEADFISTAERMQPWLR